MIMRRIRRMGIYVDTSVVSYLNPWRSPSPEAKAKKQITRLAWDFVAASQRHEFFISQMVIKECSKGHPKKAQQRLDAIAGFRKLIVNDAIGAYANDLVTIMQLKGNTVLDAMHLAIATYWNMDVLLTWNMRHLTNPVLQQKIVVYNNTKGFSTPQIITPGLFLGNGR